MTDQAATVLTPTASPCNTAPPPAAVAFSLVAAAARALQLQADRDDLIAELANRRCRSPEEAVAVSRVALDLPAAHPARTELLERVARFVRPCRSGGPGCRGGAVVSAALTLYRPRPAALPPSASALAAVAAQRGALTLLAGRSARSIPEACNAVLAAARAAGVLLDGDRTLPPGDSWRYWRRVAPTYRLVCQYRAALVAQLVGSRRLTRRDAAAVARVALEMTATDEYGRPAAGAEATLLYQRVAKHLSVN